MQRFLICIHEPHEICSCDAYKGHKTVAASCISKWSSFWLEIDLMLLYGKKLIFERDEQSNFKCNGGAALLVHMSLAEAWCSISTLPKNFNYCVFFCVFRHSLRALPLCSSLYPKRGNRNVCRLKHFVQNLGWLCTITVANRSWVCLGRRSFDFSSRTSNQQIPPVSYDLISSIK